MAIAGWDSSLFSNKHAAPCGLLQNSPAGNAFSAFACGPFAIMCLMAAGSKSAPAPGATDLDVAFSSEASSEED